MTERDGVLTLEPGETFRSPWIPMPPGANYARLHAQVIREIAIHQGNPESQPCRHTPVAGEPWALFRERIEACERCHGYGHGPPMPEFAPPSKPARVSFEDWQKHAAEAIARGQERGR